MNAVVIYYIDSSLLRPNEKMYPDTTQSFGFGGNTFN